MTSPLRAVLFDFDGTLGTYRSHLGLYVAAAAEHGIVVTEDALRATIEDTWAPWRTPLGIDHSMYSGSEDDYNAHVRRPLHIARLAAAGARGDLEAVAARICVLEADPVHYELYDDTLAGLEAMHARGLRIAIVSNHVWRLPEVIEALGFGASVDHTLTSARVGYRKAHPAIYRAALDAVDVPPEAALFVGDSVPYDIDGPRELGMRAALIDRRGAAHPEAVHTLAELPLA